ncbi:MAG: methyltransferase domain-containing protein [Proteobacteria bacterium]|nr:methyltransferase domain-containing protein [Pseudomonadota bacterium]
MTSRDYKSETMREFNRSAENYDSHSPVYYSLTRLCDDAVISQITSFNRPNAQLLDVGCGTGALLEKIRNRFPNIILNGIDIATNMLDIARKRNLSHTTFTEGDAEQLPYEDNAFDLVLCCSSFHHYPNPDQAISEFRRVTRPGGKVIICDMELPDIARLFANHILFPYQHKGDVHVYTQQEIKMLLRKHGWTQCHTERISPFQWLAEATARK